MRNLPSVIGGVLFALFIVSQVVFFGGTGLGVVREHCLAPGSSLKEGKIQVDSRWTYVLWPPLLFAPNDPNGNCIRNSPLREGLDAVGIWHLPAPEAQVREHLKQQRSDG